MANRGTLVFGLRKNHIFLLAAALIAPMASCSDPETNFIEHDGIGEAVTLDPTLDATSLAKDSGSAENGGLETEGAKSDETNADHKDPTNNEAANNNTGSNGHEDGTGAGDGNGDDNGNGEPDGTDGNEPTGDFERVTMTYQQATTSLVDILWIIDTSGSMKEEQDYLGTNFKSFIKGLSNSKLDFQTAVTSTDICPSTQPDNLEDVVCPGAADGSSSTHLRGKFVGRNGRKVLKSTDSDLVTKFSSYTALGIDGSSFEHGLKAANLAVEKVISGDNENLIRNEAFLAVIVVSDEEDDGIALGMTDAYNGKNYTELGLTKFRYTDKDFSSYLKTVKGEGKFSVSAITGTRKKDGKLCTSSHSKPQEEGTQYINAANATGGSVQSICDSNWDETLASLGQDIKSQISQIALERTPITGSIKIYVNDALTTAWTYSSGSKVVKFLPDSIPGDGATIKVEYLALPST